MKRFILFAILVTSVVGCDSGPEGPGDLTGSIVSPGAQIGGVVFEVVGGGIQGFSGAGGSKVFWAAQENPIVFRVIVIGESGGDLKFNVSVQDVSGRKPRATVISAVDPDNQPLSPITKEYKVKFTP